MGKDFETRLDAEVPATPGQVWDAIATGPGISSWFVGSTEVDGATVRTSFGDGWIPAGTITASDAPHRFAYRTATGDDGRFVAYEYLIEGRDRASTVLRTVTSGFLPGEDWADEFEAMRYGTELFFRTLLEYLRWFPGRTATPVTVFGPQVTDWPRTWRNLHAALGLDATPRAGDPVRAELTGDGVVYFTNPHTLGIRTPDALYRFIRGLNGTLIAGHELFAAAGTAGWRQFLDSLDDS
ncbi:SRPBCC domain-containing protein [Actinoplanes sp. NPDC049118]|uniref:SRPBCC family protein n=1 Tax=Actinoplanes sp. NPDC049118 TaxID=3155769 RepID=UPI003409EA1F